jgi:hypothetical protein
MKVFMECAAEVTEQRPLHNPLRRNNTCPGEDVNITYLDLLDKESLPLLNR